MFSLTASAQDRAFDGRLTEAAVPGGIRAALATLNDRVPPDRSQFLVEVIRRFHASPLQDKRDPRLAAFQALISQLENPSPQGAPDGQAETVPLPLPHRIWIDAVFGGHATTETLVPAILRSRNASLLYCALLSLDDATRQWLAEKPEFVRYLSGHAAAFLVAAPGIRVRDGRIQPPGGEAASPVWRELTTQADGPEEFIRATVELRQGRLAYFVGSLGELTDGQLVYALNLDARNPDDRVAAASRVFAAFQTTAAMWVIDRQPFLRPAFDPALLLGELREDERGRPFVPGDEGFWTAVFADSTPKRQKRNKRSASERYSSARFDWLCDRVFDGTPFEQRRRYNLVLFASRSVREISRESAKDAIDAVRAAGEYPALTATLERAGVTDASVFAAAGRRAAVLSDIRDRSRAVKALSQFQGSLALIARAAMRGGLPAGSLSRLVLSLCTIDVTERGDYDGGLVRWMNAHLTFRPDEAARIQTGSEHDEQSPTVEGHLLGRLAGSIAVNPPFVDWEGTRYRIDLAMAEAARLTRLLGSNYPPFFTSARTLLGIAGTLENRTAGPEQLGDGVAAFERLGEAIANDLGPDSRDRYRDLAASLPRAARAADVRDRARLAPLLRELADELLAYGLVDLAYAVAFGQPGAAAIPVTEAARRHDFGLAPSGQGRAWQLPQVGGGAEKVWHVTGSVLGLDVKLAQFSLIRISTRPPLRAPTMDESDRLVFVEAVTLLDPAVLADPPSGEVMAALRRGRSRLGTVRSPADVPAIADAIRLSSARRSLLEWAVAHDRGRIPAFLSLTELVWLGAGTDAPDRAYDSWGAPAEPRLGCLCLRLLDRRPWETFAGRWHAGMLASAFPDLNLRLGELLGELQMPAALLPAVLAPATIDLVENADRRDQDDRRGLVEFVQRMSRERVEEYLALLTTDGPLVPVGEAVDSALKARRVQ